MALTSESVFGKNISMEKSKEAPIDTVVCYSKESFLLASFLPPKKRKFLRLMKVKLP